MSESCVEENLSLKGSATRAVCLGGETEVGERLAMRFVDYESPKPSRADVKSEGSLCKYSKDDD